MADDVLEPTRTVLHVACNLGSGVAAVIASYAGLTPEYRHVLLADLDPSCPIEHLTSAMAEVLPLGSGAVERAWRIRSEVRRLAPDVIHAHSSYAGAFVRLAIADRDRIVHTPHCYGFTRRDLGWPARSVVWLAEAALSLRGRHVAACSPHEYRSARRLPGRRTVTYVPNAVPDRAPVPVVGHSSPLVVSVGRLCPQKSPELFAAAAELSRRRGLDLRWRWVGGGSPEYVDRLTRAGVEVTGWVPRERAWAHIAGAQVYVHTAAWESAPLTILEAAAAGVPVLARDHPALRLLGLRPLWTGVDEVVDILAGFPSAQVFAVAVAAGRELAAAHQPANQRAALLRVYAAVAAREGTPADLTPLGAGTRARRST